jgi:preprotein translocase subunit SecD
MSKNLRWRVVIIVAVIGLSIWAFYPPSEKVRLGLDLRGGVHLVMRVQTDDALRVETETTVEQLREALRADGVAFTAVEMTSSTEFRVEGIQDDAAFRRVAIADAVFERTPMVGGYTYRMRANIANQLREESVEQAIQTIERRVNELGVAEPIVARHGGQNQILVQLPGVDDVQRAKEIIRSTAFLEKKQVERAGFQTEDSARQAYGGEVPTDLQVLPGEAGEWYVVRRAPVITGRDLRTARQQLDQFNRAAVGFTLSQEGARKFDAFTSANIGRQLAIVLDGRVISAPVIQTPSFNASEVQITGEFTEREANDLATALNYGALPVELEQQQAQLVSATLGRDALNAGLVAGVVGLVLAAAYMIAFYRTLGVLAVLKLVVEGALLWTIISYLGTSSGLALTLAGITGIIVSIGVSFDSNVVYYEHLKEDVRHGRSIRSATDKSFVSAFSTIVKADVASLIGAGLLWWLTVGPVRGFAFYLAIAGLLDLVASWAYMRPAVKLATKSSYLLAHPKLLGIPAEQVAVNSGAPRTPTTTGAVR